MRYMNKKGKFTVKIAYMWFVFAIIILGVSHIIYKLLKRTVNDIWIGAIILLLGIGLSIHAKKIK